MIKRNAEYVKREFAGVSYLLPYGQGITDFSKNVRLNSTGIEIWEFLETDREKENFLTDFVKAYYPDADSGLEEEIKEDVENFLTILLAYGVLLDTEVTPVYPGVVEKDFRIAGQILRISAIEVYIPKEFAPFAAETTGVEKADLEVFLKHQEMRFQESGKLLVRNKELTIMEQETQYLFLFHPQTDISEAVLSKDGTKAEVFFELYQGAPLAEEFFQVIRFLFLYMVQKKGFFALHSVSLLYREKAWLFSGASGMGKSTHTGFWKEALGTPILNGDLNLLSIEENEAGEEEVLVHGIPWCGTSGIFDTERYSLGGIVLLKKVDDALCCHMLSEDQAGLFVSQRLISPTWTEVLQDRNLEFVKKLAKKVPVWKLDHIKDVSAVEPVREEIDRYLEREQSEIFS